MAKKFDTMDLLSGDMGTREGVAKGLKNLADLPEYQPEKNSPTPVPGKSFDSGIIGLRNRRGKTPELAIACGTNIVRYIPLVKFIALVENMKNPDKATIMLENFSNQDEKSSGRGQVLARINAKHSAISIVQGVTGRVIRGPGDIALYEVYYLPRPDLTAFYLTAKFQIGKEDDLDIMITANEGWKAYSIPLDPLNPAEFGDFEVGNDQK
jgi:hypothetical protein